MTVTVSIMVCTCTTSRTGQQLPVEQVQVISSGAVCHMPWLRTKGIAIKPGQIPNIELGQVPHTLTCPNLIHLPGLTKVQTLPASGASSATALPDLGFRIKEQSPGRQTWHRGQGGTSCWSPIPVLPSQGSLSDEEMAVGGKERVSKPS